VHETAKLIRIRRITPSAVWRDRCRDAGTSDIPVLRGCADAEAMGIASSAFGMGASPAFTDPGGALALQGARVASRCRGNGRRASSVVGGLVSVPVIAVPTSIGYGAPLAASRRCWGMLNSCASNVTV